MDLFGATVLITGASRGIGAATAKAFAAEGARVVLTARSLEKLNELVQSIGENRAMAVSADITDPLQVESLIARAEKRFGCIDILVNNAGVGLVSNVQTSLQMIYKPFSASIFSDLYIQFRRHCL